MKFFIADCHFGHFGIIPMMARTYPGTHRLFESIEAHDDLLIDTINQVVGRNDELHIIGDFSWEKPGKYRQRIKCQHVKLTLGNHDKVQACSNVFGEIPERRRMKVFNLDRTDYIKVVLDHYPGAYWDGSHKGWGLLYGHTHGQREETLEELFPQRRALDVGADNLFLRQGNYGPMPEYKVYDYMAKRSGHDDLRFYRDYQNDLYIKKGLWGKIKPLG
jgi:calcineurin-like phosphoesterase family protein